MTPQEIPTGIIFIRADARKVNDAAVRSLAASMAEVGLINPLRVRAARRHVDGVMGDAYEVTAGVHRLFAARKLGLETVPCLVVEDDDLRAELAMIDENLCRAELSPAERAASTARRKAIYEELHPETTHGGDRASRQLGDLKSERFTTDTAAATGQSERTVQRDAERGERICADALSLVRGTALDTGVYLDKLRRTPFENQADAVKQALAGVARGAERERQDAARRKADRVLEGEAKERAAERCAEILITALDHDDLTEFRAEIQATDIKTLLAKISVFCASINADPGENSAGAQGASQ